MKIKKFLLALFISPLILSSAWSLTLTDTCDYSIVSDTDYSTMVSNYEQSKLLLTSSQNLLSISNQLVNNSSTANTEYINAMLRLSDDIGKMADRIGEMADRIVATELQIGIMADRILETQKLQNENIALTQANILKAQENFNSLLIALAQ
ncbi:hypothetical protein ACM66Z_05750 [Sulfurovum sp. ST-21]|uniref:Uncharacterized protein n=1 Tax=Sulfurovum indicum TaxID=2779528 RepID=A0A7M1S0A7_9BACT|nr:hypothetical protein [Sulfurovum indicum]QOR60963.1 hypothetical protein IMZ28_05710 [Sulfurovum indicum]